MLTFEQIKELIELVARHGLGGLEIDRSGFRLKIDGFASATPQGVAAASPAALPAAAALAAPIGLPVHLGVETAGAAAAPAALPAPAAPAAAPEANAAKGPAPHVITSPIVGTFYRAASPGAPPYVEVGTHVRKGMVVCIIEAMKLMNEIESDCDGEVVEILPQNGQAVEFAEPLFGVKVSS